MTRFRSANPPTGVLAAPVLASDLTISVPSGTYTSMGRPSQVFLGQALEKLLVTFVQTGSPEVWTVTRGYDGTTPVAADAGESLERIYVESEVVYTPGAATAAIATGTVTYTPDADYKYHFLTVGGNTTLTVAAPTIAGALEPGHELRVLFLITSTALKTQPAFHATYFRSPAFSATLTANSASSISFSYRGGGISATNAWVRIN